MIRYWTFNLSSASFPVAKAENQFSALQKTRYGVEVDLSAVCQPSTMRDKPPVPSTGHAEPVTALIPVDSRFLLI